MCSKKHPFKFNCENYEIYEATHKQQGAGEQMVYMPVEKDDTGSFYKRSPRVQVPQNICDIFDTYCVLHTENVYTRSIVLTANFSGRR